MLSSLEGKSPWSIFGTRYRKEEMGVGKRRYLGGVNRGTVGSIAVHVLSHLFRLEG